jgi:NAD(P)-dependent dehydrogenase (short-subunit alcohol dehydrogenase family)
MESYAGKLAVVTGGGSGMGRQLVLQLADAGCSVATCDLWEETAEATAKAAVASAPAGTKVTGHACDVSDEAQVLRFRDEVLAAHEAVSVHLLFNNAGIGGGGSFVAGSRQEWERTFAVDWWGVYHCARAFMPFLIASDEAVIVNTSSVNGFWAALTPGMPHTAYSTAKFAVKGFSEGLIEDLRVHAPHVHVAVVMPGHIGTDIVANSRRILWGDDLPDGAALEQTRAQLVRRGLVTANASAEELQRVQEMASEAFRASAPTTAAQAATIILDAVRAGQWRILVGDDAAALDSRVRADPDTAYDHTMPMLGNCSAAGKRKRSARGRVGPSGRAGQRWKTWLA